ncbi:hypothetical protein BLOT_012051 [Blomia tropicalis]|nr:hypothetical protein BLOT_012051 [Blomia tropicalis]
MDRGLSPIVVNCSVVEQPRVGDGDDITEFVSVGFCDDIRMIISTESQSSGFPSSVRSDTMTPKPDRVFCMDWHSETQIRLMTIV